MQEHAAASKKHATIIYVVFFSREKKRENKDAARASAGERAEQLPSSLPLCQTTDARHLQRILTRGRRARPP